MRKIIEAISILGGQEADDYLSFVAATHDDDEIRAEAAAARARLQRRRRRERPVADRGAMAPWHRLTPRDAANYDVASLYFLVIAVTFDMCRSPI